MHTDCGLYCDQLGGVGYLRISESSWVVSCHITVMLWPSDLDLDLDMRRDEIE